MKQTFPLSLAFLLLLIILHSFRVPCKISRPTHKMDLDAHFFSNKIPSIDVIDEANDRLYGNTTNSIPCGTPHKNVDCYRSYDVSDIILSSDAGDDIEKSAQYQKNLQQRHANAKKLCESGSEFTGTGGWCLDGTGATQYVNFDGIQVPIPKHHVPASARIVKVFQELMIKK